MNAPSPTSTGRPSTRSIFYTLEEAAHVLGMDPADLKAEAQRRKVRAFLDGELWRFRAVDIYELVRRKGMR